MEHSVKAYLERMSKEKLEMFLRNCEESGRAIQYQDILPLVYEILSQKQDS